MTADRDGGGSRKGALSTAEQLRRPWARRIFSEGGAAKGSGGEPRMKVTDGFLDLTHAGMTCNCHPRRRRRGRRRSTAAREEEEGIGGGGGCFDRREGDRREVEIDLAKIDGKEIDGKLTSDAGGAGNKFFFERCGA